MSDWKNTPEFDAQTVTALKSAVGDDAFAAMKLQFCDDLRRLHSAYMDAKDRVDERAARETAHALKGAAANIGLARLGALAADLEMGRVENIPELAGVFDSALDHLMNAG